MPQARQQGEINWKKVITPELIGATLQKNGFPATPEMIEAIASVAEAEDFRSNVYKIGDTEIVGFGTTRNSGAFAAPSGNMLRTSIFDRTKKVTPELALDLLVRHYKPYAHKIPPSGPFLMPVMHGLYVGPAFVPDYNKEKDTQTYAQELSKMGEKIAAAHKVHQDAVRNRFDALLSDTRPLAMTRPFKVPQPEPIAARTAPPAMGERKPILTPPNATLPQGTPQNDAKPRTSRADLFRAVVNPNISTRQFVELMMQDYDVQQETPEAAPIEPAPEKKKPAADELAAPTP